MGLFTKQFDEGPAFVVINQIGKVLLQMHALNIVHLDIKENNILLTFKKENQVIRECGCLPIEFILADFGIAKDLNQLGQISNQKLR